MEKHALHAVPPADGVLLKEVPFHSLMVSIQHLMLNVG